MYLKNETPHRSIYSQLPSFIVLRFQKVFGCFCKKMQNYSNSSIDNICLTNLKFIPFCLYFQAFLCAQQLLVSVPKHTIIFSPTFKMVIKPNMYRASKANITQSKSQWHTQLGPSLSMRQQSQPHLSAIWPRVIRRCQNGKMNLNQGF